MGLIIKFKNDILSDIKIDCFKYGIKYDRLIIKDKNNNIIYDCDHEYLLKNNIVYFTFNDNAVDHVECDGIDIQTKYIHDKGFMIISKISGDIKVDQSDLSSWSECNLMDIWQINV